MINLDGDLQGQARLQGLPGGTISITKTDPLGIFLLFLP